MAKKSNTKETKKVNSLYTATPYLAIYDGKGQPIMDASSGHPIGTLCTSFFYEYSEEDPDTAEIVLESGDPNLVDNPYLDKKSKLHVQWGWIFPDGTSESGPVRTIYIKDTNESYSDNGVKLTLKCCDGPSLHKHTVRNADNSEGAFTKWVENGIKGTGDLEMVDYKVKPSLRLVNNKGKVIRG